MASGTPSDCRSDAAVSARRAGEAATRYSLIASRSCQKAATSSLVLLASMLVCSASCDADRAASYRQIVTLTATAIKPMTAAATRATRRVVLDCKYRCIASALPRIGRSGRVHTSVTYPSATLGYRAVTSCHQCAFWERLRGAARYGLERVVP